MKKKTIAIILAAIVVLVLIGFAILRSNSSTIAIIGGADGPTSIYIAE